MRCCIGRVGDLGVRNMGMYLEICEVDHDNSECEQKSAHHRRRWICGLE